MSYNITSLWLKHEKDPELKEELKRGIIASAWLFDLLEKIVKEKIKAAQIKEVDYDSASWAYRQADFNGYQRACKEILDLCSVRGDEITKETLDDEFINTVRPTPERKADNAERWNFKHFWK